MSYASVAASGPHQSAEEVSVCLFGQLHTYLRIASMEYNQMMHELRSADLLLGVSAMFTLHLVHSQYSSACSEDHPV